MAGKARHPVRNRVVAGAFLLAMGVCAVVILVVVGGWRHWFEAKQLLHIRFEAAPNVRIGSTVQLAGHPVGRVVDIQVVEVPCPPERKAGDKCYQVEAIVQMPQRYRIHQNARVSITQALVGQVAVINIEEVGFGPAVSGFLVGEQASPFAGALDDLGIGTDQKQDLSQILDNVQALTASLRKELPDIVDKLKTTGANLVEVSEKAKGTLGRIDGVLDDNRENLKVTIAHARSMAEKADQGVGEVLETLKSSTAKIETILDENRQDIRDTVTHAKSLATKADEGVGPIFERVTEASGDLRTALADFKVIASDAKALLVTNRGNLASTVQNFRETSEHLKALSKEVRRAPWRLFGTPDKEEVESLNLYDAARAFAMAAADLDTLAGTLEVMIDAKQKGIDVDPEILQGMLTRLQEMFGKYEEAENALLTEFKRIQK